MLGSHLRVAGTYLACATIDMTISTTSFSLSPIPVSSVGMILTP